MQINIYGTYNISSECADGLLQRLATFRQFENLAENIQGAKEEAGYNLETGVGCIEEHAPLGDRRQCTIELRDVFNENIKTCLQGRLVYNIICNYLIMFVTYSNF